MLAHKRGEDLSLDEGNKLRKLLTKKGTGSVQEEKDKILKARKHIYDNMSDDEKVKLLKEKRQRYATEDKENQLNAKKHMYDNMSEQDKEMYLKEKREKYKNLSEQEKKKYNEKKRKCYAVNTQSRKKFKSGKIHNREIRLAKNLRLTAIKMHDKSYQENREVVKDQFKNFYDKIKFGPDFICTCCLRTRFRKQVKKLDMENVQDVTVSGKKYNCLTHTLSFDGNEYICIAHCADNLSRGKMPRYAAANGNVLPVVPEKVKSLNDGEERLVAPRTMFIQLRKLGCDRQKGIKSNVINVPINLQKLNLQLPCPTMDNHIMQLHFKRKANYDHDYVRQNVDVKKVHEALDILVDSELFKEAGVSIKKENLKELSDEKENQLNKQLENMEINAEDCPNQVDDDDNNDDDDDNDDDWD